MFKKYLNFRLFLTILFIIIWSALFGSLLKHHYEGGENFQSLQKIAVGISVIPKTAEDLIKSIIEGKNLNRPPVFTKHKDKERFIRYILNEREALLILPRYDHSMSRSVVDVVDLKNFEVLHSYMHDIDEMNNKVKNIEEFPRLKTNNAPIRFQYRHPLILEDGSLVSDGENSIEFKIDFCSNLEWINDDETFHHSKMLDHEKNILAGGMMKPKSKYVKQYSSRDYGDDSIIKINTDGKILYKKSITEILIENNLVDENIFFFKDPIHLNDIEPALKDTKYWKKGDIFLSLRHQSAIIHYRPSTNKVINYLKGPFSQQHDVDIISDKEISIFNNNNFVINNEFSEILIYNFDTEEYKKLFNEQLKKNNFKTTTQGLSHIFEDGSLMIEEQNHGRIILFNNEGETEWEFVNKDKDGNIGFISWSRVIEDKIFIEKFKSLVENKKCLN